MNSRVTTTRPSSDHGARDLLPRGLLIGVATLAIVHIGVGLFYKLALGVDLETNLGMRPWDWWWQTVSVRLLTTDLLRSLWFLHSQPPLYNLYGAIFFNFFPQAPLQAMHFANILLGSLIPGLIAIILWHQTRNLSLSVAIGAVVALDPGLVLFEAYILYDLLTVLLVVAGVWALSQLERTGRLRYAAMFGVWLTLLVLVRSAYHILLIPIGLGLAALAAKRDWKNALLAATLPCLLAFGWYGKNFVVFGFFGASSWQGFSVWKVASLNYSPSELATLEAEGTIDRVAAQEEPWGQASVYWDYGFRETSQIPVLSQDDQHNINIIAAAKAYQRNAIRLIASDPVKYLRAVWYSYLIYSIPSAEFKHHIPNAERIGWPARFVAEVVQGGALEDYLHYPIKSFYFILVPASVAVYLAQLAWHSLRKRRGVGSFVRAHAVATWMFVLIAYTTLVGIFLETGENNRERFYIEYLVVVILAVAAYDIVLRVKSSKSKDRVLEAAGPDANLNNYSSAPT